MKKNIATLFLIVTLVSSVLSQRKFDSYGCRYKGKVATEVIEEAKITKVNGQYSESPKSFWHKAAYNLNGELIEEYPVPGTCGSSPPDKRVKIVVDKEKNTRTEIAYDNRDKPLAKDVWTYDARGNVLDWSFYSFNKKSNKWRLWGRWVSTYDEKGNQTKSVRLNGKGKMERGETYQYDERNNLTEHSWLRADATIRDTLKYTYEYDEQGNWIKRTTWVRITQVNASSFEPHEITYRTITYHTGN
ncbi:MAG: hypothetical protein AB1757_12480 [Acidobacteriota bacterium]